MSIAKRWIPPTSSSRFTNGQTMLTADFPWANPPGYTQEYSVPQHQRHRRCRFSRSDQYGELYRKRFRQQTSHVSCAVPLLEKLTYKGMPAPDATTIDLSGNWIGTRRENGQLFNEFFSLVFLPGRQSVSQRIFRTLPTSRTSSSQRTDRERLIRSAESRCSPSKRKSASLL